MQYVYFSRMCNEQRTLVVEVLTSWMDVPSVDTSAILTSHVGGDAGTDLEAWLTEVRCSSPGFVSCVGELVTWTTSSELWSKLSLDSEVMMFADRLDADPVENSTAKTQAPKDGYTQFSSVRVRTFILRRSNSLDRHKCELKSRPYRPNGTASFQSALPGIPFQLRPGKSSHCLRSGGN